MSVKTELVEVVTLTEDLIEIFIVAGINQLKTGMYQYSKTTYILLDK